MKLFDKMLKRNKEKIYPNSIMSVEEYSNDLLIKTIQLNNLIAKLSTLRTKKNQAERKNTIDEIIQVVDEIDLINSQLLQDLSRIEKILKDKHDDSFEADKIRFDDYNMKIEKLLEMKKQIRLELENIYINFRKVVKNLNCDDIPLNKISTQMRTAFNFDGNTANYFFRKNIKLNEDNRIKYYDSTTKQIRYIDI